MFKVSLIIYELLFQQKSVILNLILIIVIKYSVFYSVEDVNDKIPILNS